MRDRELRIIENELSGLLIRLSYIEPIDKVVSARNCIVDAQGHVVGARKQFEHDDDSKRYDI